MSNHLTDTEIFRRSAGLPVADTQTTPSLSDRKLNLALLLEEVRELAVSYGLTKTLDNLMLDSMDVTGLFDLEIWSQDTEEYNPVEVLDALADIQVILDGATLTSGFQDVMPDALKEVFRSNMSKVDLTHEEAQMEATTYREAYAERVPNQGWVIRRTSDGKLLKPSTYLPPSLSQFIQPD